MKIIVTEDQFKLLQENDNNFIKTKSVIDSMCDQGMEISDIKKLNKKYGNYNVRITRKN